MPPPASHALYLALLCPAHPWSWHGPTLPQGPLRGAGGLPLTHMCKIRSPRQQPGATTIHPRHTGSPGSRTLLGGWAEAHEYFIVEFLRSAASRQLGAQSFCLADLCLRPLSPSCQQRVFQGALHC